ncbi:MAG: hypothetical protein KF745_07860 [Phycisphaeraceae bacterium]|nr:hypothetical protein [Phycisphaeraceae bacterium]
MPNPRHELPAARRTAACAAAMVLASTACAQLRIVSYNTGGANRAGMQDVLTAIGTETRSGIARPIDVLSLQEQDAALAVTQSILATLDAAYGTGIYARSTLAGAGDTTQAIIFNTQTVQLIGQNRIGTTSGSGAPRQPMRFRLRPVGYTSAADFYLYSNHYKAGDSDAIRRNVEAQMVRADAAALGPNARIIYSGDFNIYGSNETMWSTLTAPGDGQAFDPLNRVGLWGSNPAFADVHTQSPVVSMNQNYPGQTGGGLDDRFDWQMTTAPVLSGRGFAYIPGTYHALGNSGHSYNANLSVAAPSWLQPYFPGVTPADITGLLQTLERVSDHLPVVADYQLPARMNVVVTTPAPRVIRGTPLSLDVSITNSALVSIPIGADLLSFTVQAAGGLAAPPISGVAAAASAPVRVQSPIDTQASGPRSGSVTVTTDSPGAPVTQVVSSEIHVEVAEHARASFSAEAATTSLEVDFGAVTLGSAAPEAPVSIFNVASPGLLTAALDLDEVLTAPDTPAITATLTPFQALEPGGQHVFLVSISTAVPGEFTEVLSLRFSDEDIPGASDNPAPLLLTIRGRIQTACASDWNLDGTVTPTDVAAFINDWLASLQQGTTAGDFDGNSAIEPADVATFVSTWLSELAGSC